MNNQDFPKTLSERIYNYLKEAITGGTIEANQRIQEKEIASQFNVSTTPVREAIKKLAGEGLIQISSHREAIVRELSFKELLDIYHALVCIDEMSVKLAAHTALGPMTKEVEKYADKVEKLAQEEVEDWLEITEKMYLRICELSGNQFLYQIRQMINAQLGRYKPLRIFLFTKSPMIKVWMQKLGELLEALRAKDINQIESVEIGRWLQFFPSEDKWNEYQNRKNQRYVI